MQTCIFFTQTKIVEKFKNLNCNTLNKWLVNRELETQELKTQSTLSYLSSEYYLSNNHIIFNRGPISAKTYPDFSGEAMFSGAPVPSHLCVWGTTNLSPTPSLPHISSYSYLCYLSRISTCMRKGQGETVTPLDKVRNKSNWSIPCPVS